MNFGKDRGMVKSQNMPMERKSRERETKKKK